MTRRTRIQLGAASLVFLGTAAAAGAIAQHTDARPAPRPASTTYVPGGINNVHKLFFPPVRTRP